LYVTFVVINYFVMLGSVFSFTSFLVFWAQHYWCLLHKWHFASDITEISCTTLKNCYRVLSHASHTRKMWPTSPFPRCVLANWTAGFLLETGDVSWKLRLCCSVQFPLCVLTLTLYMHFQACFLELIKLWKPHIVTVWVSRGSGRTIIWYYAGNEIYVTTPHAVCSCWSKSVSSTETASYCRVLPGENIFVSWCWVDIWLSHQLSVPSILEFILVNHHLMQKHYSSLFYSSSL
jgi:hypothetical protein